MNKKTIWLSLSVITVLLAWCSGSNNQTSTKKISNTTNWTNIVSVKQWQHNVKTNWTLNSLKKEITNNTKQVDNLDKNYKDLEQTNNKVKEKIEEQLKDNTISEEQKKVLQQQYVSIIKKIDPNIKKLNETLSELKNEKQQLEKQLQTFKNNTEQNKDNSKINILRKNIKNVQKLIQNTNSNITKLNNQLDNINISTNSKAYVKKINKKLNVQHLEEKIKRLPVNAIQLKPTNKLPKILDKKIINNITQFLSWKIPNSNDNKDNMDKLWKICSIKPNRSNLIVNKDNISLKINNNTILSNYNQWCKYYIIAKQLNYNLRFNFIKIKNSNTPDNVYTLWWWKLKWDIYNITLLYFIKNNPKFLSNIIKQYWQGNTISTVIYILQNSILSEFL